MKYAYVGNFMRCNYFFFIITYLVYCSDDNDVCFTPSYSNPFVLACEKRRINIGCKEVINEIT
jgi:hypothetical protein